MKQEFNLFIVKWLKIKNTQRTFRNSNNRIDPITPQHKDVPSCCTAPMCLKSLSKHIRFYCKKLNASRINRIVMHGVRASCSNAPLCHTSPSRQIRSYWHRDVLCVSLHRCVIVGHFWNSCFNFAHEKRFGRKFKCNTPVKHN